jgi:hypothetical protein
MAAACSYHVEVTNMGGRYSWCKYLPHINYLEVVYVLVVGRNTTNSKLHAADLIVALARSISEVTSSQHVTRLLTPNPVLPELRAWTLYRQLGEKPLSGSFPTAVWLACKSKNC